MAATARRGWQRRRRSGDACDELLLSADVTALPRVFREALLPCGGGDGVMSQHSHFIPPLPPFSAAGVDSHD
jgi:hypothetical protein